MRLGKHSAQGKGGDNSEGIKPHFPCIPSKKSLDFFEAATAQALLPCHATPPSVYARFPSDSEQIRPGCARPGIYSSLQSNRATPGASHFFLVMLHLPPLTPGFPPTRNSHGGLCPPEMAIPRFSPTGLLRGLRTSSLSRLACSQRLASLRFGTKPGGCAPLGFIPHFAPSSLLTTAQTLLNYRCVYDLWESISPTIRSPQVWIIWSRD